MQDYYQEDLAYIHDVGFGNYALNSAPGILEILNSQNIKEGIIIELGCGSGLLTQKLLQADYQVMGIDISQSMINIAKKRVPNGSFRVASLFDVQIPSADAVISIGECLNYLFDLNNNRDNLNKLFQRIYQGLKPGGIFIFDILELEAISSQVGQSFTEGDDWIILVDKEENRQEKTLTRRITTLRKVGDLYKRNDEIHRVLLYNAQEITSQLLQVGFEVQIIKNYGEFILPNARSAFIAKKT